MALLAAVVLATLVLATKAEQRVPLPLAVEELPLADVRHGPTRDWLHTYTLVLADLGFVPGPILLVPTGLTTGRAAFAWFSHPERPTRALLEATARRHGVAFMDGVGAGRIETATHAQPLTLWDREPIDRQARTDLTDPARLLRAHAARLELADPPPTAVEAVDPRTELVASYQRVLDADAERGWRRVGARGSHPTLRGRAAAVLRQARAWVRRHADEARRA